MLARLRADQIGFYPPYAAATGAVATYLGVAPDRVTLVNGLDEGITGIAIAFIVNFLLNLRIVFHTRL